MVRATSHDHGELGPSRVLITTDVWARGIDVQQVSLVINYDLPINREVYIHRYVRASAQVGTVDKGEGGERQREQGPG